MKKLTLVLIIAFALCSAQAQSVHVLITNGSQPAELNIENNTKHVEGFLYDKGNGRTEFRKAVLLNDSDLLFGEDTPVIRGGDANTPTIPNNSGRLIPRVGATTSLATITPDAVTQDVYKITALAVNANIATPTRRFTDRQMIILRTKDNGTSRTLTWNVMCRTGQQIDLPASWIL